jgi:hypothetical protein
MLSVFSWRLWNTKERKNETEDKKRVVVQPWLTEHTGTEISLSSFTSLPPLIAPFAACFKTKRANRRRNCERVDVWFGEFLVYGDIWQSGWRNLINWGLKFCECCVFSVLCTSRIRNNSSWHKILCVYRSRLKSVRSCQLLKVRLPSYSSVNRKKVSLAWKYISLFFICRRNDNITYRKACSVEIPLLYCHLFLSGTSHSSQFSSAGPKSWFQPQGLKVHQHM